MLKTETEQVMNKQSLFAIRSNTPYILTYIRSYVLIYILIYILIIYALKTLPDREQKPKAHRTPLAQAMKITGPLRKPTHEGSQHHSLHLRIKHVHRRLLGRIPWTAGRSLGPPLQAREGDPED